MGEAVAGLETGGQVDGERHIAAERHRVQGGRLPQPATEHLGADRSDKLLFPRLSATVLLGIAATAAHNVFGAGYDYSSTISVWFRGLFTLQPRPEAIADAPLLFQLRALTACLLFAACPSPASSMYGACRWAGWPAPVGLPAGRGRGTGDPYGGREAARTES
ncbi:respiratory nitrate reductase subunit gamma [Streptomyces sp. RG80]|uniref:respiratory nitrate reductase subunit gamma n=1 Tax=Streptomyces sp. RG80 TaxID=3157340 RepID=UPI00338FEE90